MALFWRIVQGYILSWCGKQGGRCVKNLVTPCPLAGRRARQFLAISSFSLLVRSKTLAHWAVLLTFKKGFPVPVTLIEKIIAPMPEAYLFSELRFCRVDINSQRVHFSCGVPVAWNGMS